VLIGAIGAVSGGITNLFKRDTTTRRTLEIGVIAGTVVRLTRVQAETIVEQSAVIVLHCAHGTINFILPSWTIWFPVTFVSVQDASAVVTSCKIRWTGGLSVVLNVCLTQNKLDVSLTVF
jgi:hypothetical protein